jgi:hypothetical protein
VSLTAAVATTTSTTPVATTTTRAWGLGLVHTDGATLQDRYTMPRLEHESVVHTALSLKPTACSRPAVSGNGTTSTVCNGTQRARYRQPSRCAWQNERAFCSAGAHIELLLVQLGNGLLGSSSIRHGHKGKATRAATLAVLGDEGILCMQTTDTARVSFDLDTECCHQLAIMRAW